MNLDGWTVVTKTAGAQSAEIRTALVAKAKALGLKVSDAEFGVMTNEAAEYITKGFEFNAAGWGDRLKVAAAKPKPPPPEEDDEEDEDKKPPKPRRGKEPPGGRVPWVGKATESPLERAEAAYRKSVMGSDLAVERLSKVADVVQAQSPRATRQQAIAQVTKTATGSNVMTKMERVAEVLIEYGDPPGRAMQKAAEVVGDMLHQQLAERSGVTKNTVDPVVAQVGGAIRLARIRKNLSREVVAKSVPTSVTTIAEWETGDHLPTGSNALQLARVLDDPSLIERINAARNQGGR